MTLVNTVFRDLRKAISSNARESLEAEEEKERQEIRKRFADDGKKHLSTRDHASTIKP